MNDVVQDIEYRAYVTTLDESAEVIEPLCARQYAEMRERLLSQGVPLGPYKPRYDEYFRAAKAGYLIPFRLDWGGECVGYCMMYVTNDMHNSELIAQEDTVYVLPEHRNGAGRRLIRFVHDEMKRRGCKRINITTGTDLRVSKLLERLGYRHTAHCMTLILQE